jgi:hypothetical protein
MANEIFYSGSGDVRLTEILAAEYQLLLADRFSLFGHPAIMYAGNAGNNGSTVIKVPLVGLAGYDRMVAVAENASAANTALTDGSAQVTIARQALQRQISDLNEMVDSLGVNVEALIRDGVGAYAMRWMEMLTSLLGSFSSTAGTTTVDLDVTEFLAAKYALIQNGVPGKALATLYPVQVTDLMNSIRGETGPIEHRMDAQNVFDAQGQGILYTFANVDVVSSSLVGTANAGNDSAGGMFAHGAIAYADGLPKAVRGGNEVVFAAGTRLFTEIERDASGGLSKIVHNAYLGFAEIQDLMGVSIISDR